MVYHGDKTPVVAATDGGVIEARADADPDDVDGEDDARPDDCSCDQFEQDVDLPCSPRWRESFRTPNASADSE